MENINKSSSKGVFLGKHHNLKFVEFELTNSIGAVLNHQAVRL